MIKVVAQNSRKTLILNKNILFGWFPCAGPCSQCNWHWEDPEWTHAADPGKSCWFVLNAYLSMNHSGNMPKALFYDHIITYTFKPFTFKPRKEYFGPPALFISFHFIDRRWSALNDPCNDNPGLMSQETADKRGFGFIIHKSIENPISGW